MSGAGQGSDTVDGAGGDDLTRPLAHALSIMAPSVKQVVEGALLAAGGPLSRDQLLALYPDDARPPRAEIDAAVDELRQDYRERAVELVEVAGGWRMQVRARVAPWVARLWDEKPARYSRALLETLALIAYRQPITRGEIEDIRGVAVSTQIIKTLSERDWIRIVGHRDVPGRPALFATTRRFLDSFGLRSLNELPPLADIRDPAYFGEELADDGDGRETESVAGPEGLRVPPLDACGGDGSTSTPGGQTSESGAAAEHDDPSDAGGDGEPGDDPAA